MKYWGLIFTFIVLLTSCDHVNISTNVPEAQARVFSSADSVTITAAIINEDYTKPLPARFYIQNGKQHIVIVHKHGYYLATEQINDQRNIYVPLKPLNK